jgi:inner membrane protein
VPSFFCFDQETSHNGVAMGIIDPALYWLIIGVMLFFLEFAAPVFVLFFFALGALVTALFTWLFQIDLAWQLALFIVASLIPLLSLRNIIQKRLVGSSSATEESEEKDEDVLRAVPGEKGVVSVTIAPPAEGRVKYSGTSWRAIAEEEIEEGEIVTIVCQKNLVLQVEKV